MKKQVAYTVVMGGESFVDGVNGLGEYAGFTDPLLDETRNGLDVVDEARNEEPRQFVRVTVEYFNTADEAFVGDNSSTSVG